MQEARAHFTTIHREWAARLLDRALASDRASPDADRLLSQVFDFSCAAPERLVRTWSWFRNLPAAGKWTRQVLATKDASEWKTLVGRAAEHDLSTLCFLAEEMHLLFRTPGWGQTVADAFETHESKICRLLTSAKPTDWWSLTRLAWTIGHANQPLASRVWSTFDPSMVAALIEATHPDYLESLSTFLSSASKESSTWATQVGRALNVDLMLNQLHGISQGDAESAFSAMKILRKLGVPIRRSTIRRVAEAFGKALENCPLRSFHLCFAPVWDPTWLIFDRDIQASLVRINEESLARDLESGSPREWRRFSDLTMFAVPSLANLERRIVDRITPEVLARNVSSTAEGHEYELRCLLWSLSRGTKKAKGVIARALYKTVLRACQRVDQERPQLLKALYAVDPEQAERLKAELVPYGEPEKQDWELRETWLDKRDRKLFHRDIIRLKERYAAAEKSGEDYVFEAWTQEDEVGPS